jgi:hypothetical protein
MNGAGSMQCLPNEVVERIFLHLGFVAAAPPDGDHQSLRGILLNGTRLSRTEDNSGKSRENRFSL